MSASRTLTIPTIVILSIGEEQDLLEPVHGRLLQKIAQRSNVRYAKTTKEALDLLENPANIDGILVSDPGIIGRRNVAVAAHVILFARNGGTVVFGGLFSSFIRVDYLDAYFKTFWNLPWTAGSYTREVVSLNQTAQGVSNKPLVLSYSQKAVFLTNVKKDAAWYLPPEYDPPESDSESESERIFRPRHTEDNAEAAVTFTKVGNGYLGYVGDVNAELGTDSVVLAMLGLF